MPHEAETAPAPGPRPNAPRRSARDSQEALALSIARAVQLGLPAPDSEEAIRESVEHALLEESRKNERLLASLRAGVLGCVALLALSALALPTPFGDAGVTLWAALGSLCAWGAATAFLIVLSRGWYRRWVTRVVPAIDAAGIVAGFVLAQNAFGAVPARGAPLGSFSAAAVACSFLAFSGSLRLSRPSARFALGAALVAWGSVWWVGRLPWPDAVIVTVLIVATGWLAGRVTRIIRRIITDEILRLRLQALYKNAQEAIDAREEVLKIVSHDLRNPLGTIAMAADLLLDMPTTEAQRARQLGIIKRQGERMRRLINDLLDAARLEAGRITVEPTVEDVPALLDSVLEMMRPLAEERGLRLETLLPPDLPPVRVDSERIHQVFSNLIGNAIKFTPEGGQVTLKATRAASKIRLSVSDTGPGIPPEQLSQIFNHMWQARNDDTRGIGLGLTIAKAIVEAHGERIGVDSRVGEGTEFWFTVPVATER